MLTRRLTAAAILTLASLSACTESGAIHGLITQPKDGGEVTLHYRTDRFTDNGTMTAVLPGGEQYSGRFLQVTSDTDADTLDPYWGGWDVGWDGWGPWTDDYGPYIVGADVPTFIRNYSGKVIATLLGDRGGRLRCRFRVADPEEGMSSGGVGECQTGSGERIDATF